MDDVVVLGGGVIGLCSAYYLQRAGASVTVVDKGEMGHGSSLHNAGYVSPSHLVPLAAPGVFAQGLRWMFNPTSPLYLKPRLDPYFLSWAWRFRKACGERVAQRAIPVLRDLLVESAHLFEGLSKVEGMDFDLTRNGIINLYRTDKGKQKCEHEAELAARVGVEARLVDRNELAKLDPHIEFRAPGGLYFPGDMHLVPAALVMNLSDYLGRHGVRLLPNCSVTGFEKAGERVVRVHTQNGTMKADEFVLAGGAWSPLLLRPLGIKMHLQAGKGYSITINNPVVKPRIPYILTESRVAVTPFADSLRFAGTMEFAGIDVSINRRRVEAILDVVPLYFGNIERPDSSRGEIWGGLRPVTPDGMPYIGRCARVPNLVVATGHAMLGVSLATVTGKIVAEIIGGQPQSRDLKLVDPNRYDKN